MSLIPESFSDACSFLRSDVRAGVGADYSLLLLWKRAVDLGRRLATIESTVEVSEVRFWRGPTGGERRVTTLVDLAADLQDLIVQFRVRSSATGVVFEPSCSLRVGSCGRPGFLLVDLVFFSCDLRSDRWREDLRARIDVAVNVASEAGADQVVLSRGDGFLADEPLETISSILLWARQR